MLQWKHYPILRDTMELCNRSEIILSQRPNSYTTKEVSRDRKKVWQLLDYERHILRRLYVYLHLHIQ